ncbi:hypothetical protein BH10CYA1_BH10CYA1_59940 [soil metagenome]
MSDKLSKLPIGYYVGLIREEGGLTQAQLAQRITLSSATISRIESGDKDVTMDELLTILKAFGTPKAEQFIEYLQQDWDELERPVFDHPNRTSLWEANLALRKLSELRKDPDLRSVFLQQADLYEKELRRLALYLRSREHQIAFIGSIGVGKSTGICKLTALVKPGEDKLDRQIVLETGAGGITLCEVHIFHGPKYGILITPRSEDSIRRDVEDFAEYLIKTTCPDDNTARPLSNEDNDLLGISKEVVRAIRNMSKLTEQRKEEGGKKVRFDPAKELARQFPNTQELAIQILTRMDLLRRNRHDAWYPDDSSLSPTQWLQQIFSDVNNGRHAEITLPQQIEIVVPDSVLASQDLPIKIIDTKGIDQTPHRQDLECHFDDPRTLVVLCSRFNDAPEIAVQTLLQRAKEAGVKNIERKTVVLVLPRTDEASAVKHDDGAQVEDDQEGYDLKRDQIEIPLKHMGFSEFSVEFFNAKEELPEHVRDRLLSKITEYREDYSTEIKRMSEAIQHLIENREDEEIRLVFEQVNSHLNTWINKNRQIDWPKFEVHKQLISAIDTTRYAATINASVRRHGQWSNLDYFHELAVGTRRNAVILIGERIRNFKVIVQNLIDDPALDAAKEFLHSLLERLDAALEDAYRKLQIGGREAFRSDLETDLEFWRECEKSWGAGPGYKSTISQMTDSQFLLYDGARQLVKNLIANEWMDLVSMLESMLKESEHKTADSFTKM